MRGDKNEEHKWSPKNASVLDADDWELASVGGVAGGTLLGAGSLFFAFRSSELRQYLKFAFVGGGAAAGLVGGWNDPQDVEFDCSRADWQKMKPGIAEPFSAANLCNAHGRVSVLSVGTPGKIGWGYTKMIVTAIYNGTHRQGFLFDRFEFGGVGFGTGGIGAGVLWGKWVFLGVPSATRLDNNWTKPVCQ